MTTNKTCAVVSYRDNEHDNTCAVVSDCSDCDNERIDDREDRVYEFGCLSPDREDIAIQLLGQAFNLRNSYVSALNKARAIPKESDEKPNAIASSNLAGPDIREARASRGHLVDWGTYTLVEAEVAAAARATPKSRRIRHKDWDGTGRIGAYIASVDKFPAAPDMSVNHKRVTMPPPDAKGYTTITLVVGAAANPVKITWPIKIHRKFPTGTIVKGVYVQRLRTNQRTRKGERFRWKASFVVNIPKHVDPQAEGYVGLDIGWRWTEGSLLRVGTLSRSVPGFGRELYVDVLEDLARVDAIASVRDKNFDVAKAYAKENGLGPAHVLQWRSKNKLRKLANSTGDLTLKAWSDRDEHLQNYQEGLRSRALLRRRDLYRAIADALAKMYRYLVIENIHVSEMPPAKTHGAQARRDGAAIAMLIRILTERFGKDRILRVDPYATSATCSECGAQEWELGEREFWRCGACGTDHQRDENAAVNIERLGAEGKTVTARAAKPRRKKRNSKKGESVDTSAEASSREAPCKAA